MSTISHGGIHNPATPTWFNTAERVRKLQIASAAWVGTPFRNNSRVAGERGGVDCKNLASEVFFECGCLDRFDLPRLTVRQLQGQGATEALITYVDEHLASKFCKVDVDIEPVVTGDLVVMRDERMLKHVGIVQPAGYLLHVLTFCGVMLSHVIDPTYGRIIEHIRRPKP